MARLETTDLLTVFRFHVTAADDFFKFEGSQSVGGEAGFNQVTIPEVSAEASEYREGTMTWTRKFPGPPTVTDGTMMRGVAKTDTKFFDWILSAIQGGEYRTDLQVNQYHREEADAQGGPSESNSRKYIWHEAFPIRVKPTGDMDATSSEVAIAEVDIALEWFEIESTG